MATNVIGYGEAAGIARGAKVQDLIKQGYGATAKMHDLTVKQREMSDNTLKGGNEVATASNGVTDDGIGKNTDMVSTSKQKTLTLGEQRALAAYAQYSIPQFYIPPLLVTDTGNEKDLGKGDRAGFIFLNIGNLRIIDTTFPRNVPILKVPDADIDAVQDMGFGSGNIKVSGLLWAEAGFARLQTLRELCKSRRPLIWSSQETGPWYVFPLNVPGLNTVADKPHQYKFEVTFVCVAQLNKQDKVVEHYAKLRKRLVAKKFNREQAIIDAQNSVENRIKSFDTLVGGNTNGVKKGYYYDPATGNMSYNPDVTDLEADVGKYSGGAVTGATGAGNIKQHIEESQSQSDRIDTMINAINKRAVELTPAENDNVDRGIWGVRTGGDSVSNSIKNLGAPTNLNVGGAGRSPQKSSNVPDDAVKTWTDYGKDLQKYKTKNRIIGG